MKLGFSTLFAVFLVGCKTLPQTPDMQYQPIDLSHLEKVIDWDEAAHLERRIGLHR